MENESPRKIQNQEDVEWLRSLLAGGPVASEEVRSASKAEGWSLRRLKNAQRRLGIVPRKDGFQGGWSWSLPRARARVVPGPLRETRTPSA